MNYILHVTAFATILLTTTGAYAACDEHFDYTEATPLVGQVSGLNSGWVSNKVDVNGVTVAVSAFDPNGHGMWNTITELKGEGKKVSVVTKGCLDTNPDDTSDTTNLTRKFHHVVHAFESK